MTLQIKNIEKSSVIEYPPHISAVLFLQGCNWNCKFCYNTSLIPKENDSLPTIPTEEILEWLKERYGKLTACTITGGEPSIYGNELLEFMHKIKEIGYKIKLDTNGSDPTFIRTAIDAQIVDYIAMDIKSDEEGYPIITQSEIKHSDIKKSIDLIKDSGIDYEFRMTVIPDHHDEMLVNRAMLQTYRSKKFALQQYKNIEDKSKNCPIEYLNKLKSFNCAIAENVEVRY